MVFIRNCRQENDQISSAATRSAEINEPEISEPEVNQRPPLIQNIPIPPSLPNNDAFENVECSTKTRGETRVSTLFLVQKKISNLKTSKLRDFHTKKMSQLHKDKICLSEIIFSFWSSNVFPIKSNIAPRLQCSLNE